MRVSFDFKPYEYVGKLSFLYSPGNILLRACCWGDPVQKTYVEVGLIAAGQPITGGSLVLSCTQLAMSSIRTAAFGPNELFLQTWGPIKLVANLCRTDGAWEKIVQITYQSLYFWPLSCLYFSIIEVHYSNILFVFTSLQVLQLKYFSHIGYMAEK